ncbi:MAG TPA: O-antigen ligase family protein [Planctomycetota bacterium]|nr:O-antigen ligase family protein [Planctomycetota bacterium]
MTLAASVEERSTRFGAFEIVALVLIGITPLMYYPGLTFEYSYLKLVLFQLVAIVGLVAMALRLEAPAEWVRPRLRLILPAASLLLWMFMSVAWHRYSWAAPAALVRESTFLAGFIGLSFLLSSPRARRTFAVWLVPALVVAVVLIIYCLKAGRMAYFGNQNLAAGFLVLPITVLIAVVLDPPAKISAAAHYGLGVCALAAAYALQVTASRGAWAGVAIGAFLVLVLILKHRRYLLIAGAVALIAVLGYLCMSPEQARELFGIRLSLWRGAANMISSAPLLGQGVGGYTAAIRAFQPLEYFAHPAAAATTLHAHCQPLEVTAELGVIGMLLFGALVAGLLFSARKARKKTEGFDRTLITGMVCGLVAMIVHGLVEVGPYYPDVQISFWLGAAFICGAMAVPAASAESRGAGILPGRLPLALGLVVLFLLPFIMLSVQGIVGRISYARAHSTNLVKDRVELLQQSKNQLPYEDDMKVQTRMQLAYLHYLRKQPALALTEYEEIEKLGPNYGGVRVHIAQAYNSMSRPDEALKYAEQALRANPFDLDAAVLWLGSLPAEPQASAERGAEVLAVAEKMKPFETTLAEFREKQKTQRDLDFQFFEHTMRIPRVILLRGAFLKRAGRAAEADVLFLKVSRQCSDLAQALVVNLLRSQEMLKQADKEIQGQGFAQQVIITRYMSSLFDMWLRTGGESGRDGIIAAAADALHSMIKNKLIVVREIKFEFSLQAAELYQRAGNAQRANQLLLELVEEVKAETQAGQPESTASMERLARAYAMYNPRLAVETAQRLQQQQPDNALAKQIIQKLGGK